ncbi:MAG: chemotaxis response regulator protein-glutamate methylesterase [Desulfurococcales archaeon ex4484_42]|nr:MAG: chemotaxis response regulator protein-glutamate methylesterase [Desulfurococcales archaeon ex4484_42]
MLLGRKHIKVIIVDDSRLTRRVLRNTLENDPLIKVVGEASNGLEAIDKVLSLNPDVVIMDVVMPKMDGITAIKEILKVKPVPILVFSSITEEGSKAALDALEAGALEVIPKPGGTPIITDLKNLKDELIRKVKVLASIGRAKLSARLSLLTLRPEVTSAPLETPGITDKPAPTVAVIASSTGGPQALMKVIPKVSVAPISALLIVQHMPPLFTKALAEKLDRVSVFKIKEAEDGEEVLTCHGYVAPGDYHMRVQIRRGKPRIELDKGPKIHGVRPAADITMKDVANVWGPATVAAVLTGMGCDGAEGAAAIKAKGGYVIAQDERTSIVWGMPKAVVTRGLADKVLPVDTIGTEINRVLYLKARECCIRWLA